MHPIITDFLKALPETQPITYKAIYPKRIEPPQGFLNPKYFAITLWSELKVGFEHEMTMLPHITGLVNALMQLEYQVPTYFVRSEFAQAVAQTEPPADFKFSEIRWPLPAMLFVLPTNFVLHHFGFMCPFLSVSCPRKGVYPAMLKHLPPCTDLRNVGMFKPPTSLYHISPLDNQVDRFNIVYPVYSKDRVPVDYTGSYPLTMNISEMGTAPYHDATYMEEESMPGVANTFGLHSGPEASDLPAEGEQEKLFNQKVQMFAVKLMLALTARPTLIVPGGVSRPARIKKGRKFDELWHPNLIGWTYQAKREIASGQQGTHASPRMHWRRGHMRNQPYGPKPWNDSTPKRLTWIEPVLINANTANT